MNAGIAALVVALALPVAVRSEEEPVDIGLTPRTCVAPCTVRLAIRIPAEASNRSVTITADAPDFYRSSTRQLDESGGPRHHELLLESLPPGDYEIRVTVDRADGEDTQRTRTLRVHGDAESMERDQPS